MYYRDAFIEDLTLELVPHSSVLSSTKSPSE